MENSIKVTDKVEIKGLTLSDPQVIAAAKTAESDSRDLAEYFTQAIEIGIKALLATGVSIGVEILAEGIEASKDAMTKASKNFSDELKLKVEGMVGPDGSLTKTISEHLEEFASELESLTGGENSPIREGIQKQLDKATKKLNDDFERVAKSQKTEMFDLLDMANPQSPLKKVGDELRAVAEVVGQLREKLNQDVVVAEIMSEVPQGGNDYEAEAISAVQIIAGWAGDDCLAVGHLTGHVARSKKGDGVIDLRVGANVFARIVVECKDSDLTKTEWTAESEGGKANRGASGFIGLCKEISDMPNKSRMMVLDSQGIVLAYDPSKDDPQILHLIYQVVKFNTLRSTGNLGELDMAEINKYLEDALDALDKFDGINKSLTAIENSVTTIRREAKGIRTSMTDNISAVRRSISQGIEPASALEASAPRELEGEYEEDEAE